MKVYDSMITPSILHLLKSRMPNIVLAIEYLLGGTQLVALFLYMLALRNPSLYWAFDTPLVAIVFLSLAYPFGIIADNICHALVKFPGAIFRATTGFKETKKEGHEELFFKLIEQDLPSQLKRAAGFESSKRLMRISIFNSSLIILLELSHISANQGGNYSNILLIMMVLFMLASVFSYWRINKAYFKYLHRMNS